MEMYHVFGLSYILSACASGTCRVSSNSPNALAAFLGRYSRAAATADFGPKGGLDASVEQVNTRSTGCRVVWHGSKLRQVRRPASPVVS